VGNRFRRVARPVDRIVMGMVMGFIVNDSDKKERIASAG